MRHQSKLKRPLIWDALDKYNKGITTPIHDPHPGSAYTYMDPAAFNEWKTFNENKLLAIPFENDAQSPKLHEDICDQIFAAVEEITQSQNFGIATPLSQEEALEVQKIRNQDSDQEQSHKKLPTTFLIHSLSSVHYSILTQQTVWASTNITF